MLISFLSIESQTPSKFFKKNYRNNKLKKKYLINKLLLKMTNIIYIVFTLMIYFFNVFKKDNKKFDSFYISMFKSKKIDENIDVLSFLKVWKFLKWKKVSQLEI